MDIPVKYGSYVTAWRKLKRWQREGVWKRILEALISKGYSMGRLRLDEVAVDSKGFIEVMEGIRVKHGVGRPKSRLSIRHKRDKGVPQEKRDKGEHTGQPEE